MSLSPGVSTNSPFTGVNTGTTGTVTTQATGSGIVVDVGWSVNSTAPVITDNKGNTYTQLGATITDTGNQLFLGRFQKLSAAGGAGHTFTATWAGGGRDFTIFMTEILTTNGNGVTVGQSPAGNFTSTSPYTTNSAVTTTAAEFALVVTIPFAFPGADTVAWGNSFLALQNQPDTNLVNGHTAYRVLTVTGTYAASFTATGAPTTDALFQFTTYDEAAGANVGCNVIGYSYVTA